MRSFFIFYIIAAGCFLLLLSSWQRKKLTRLLGTQTGRATSENMSRQAVRLAVTKCKDYIRVFEPENKSILIRNIIIPGTGIVALAVVNYFYIHLPAYWFIPAATPVIFFIWRLMLVKKKRKEFNDNFTEALTTIGGAVSSGRTFIQAMADYSFMSDNSLAREFGIISRRLNMGENAELVFNESWKRYPYGEYYFFIVAILLNLHSGGKLKEVLMKLQRSISTGAAMEKKMMAMTAEMRMSVKITGAIPFLFLFLTKFISAENYDYIINDPSGNYILYYLLGSELIGIGIIKFLMRGV